MPKYYTDKIINSLGPLAEWLPEKAMQHDPYAYCNSVDLGLEKLYQPAV